MFMSDTVTVIVIIHFKKIRAADAIETVVLPEFYTMTGRVV